MEWTLLGMSCSASALPYEPERGNHDLYKMKWHDADPIKQDQANEAQVRRSTPGSNLRDSRRYAGRNPFRLAFRLRWQ
jgi:hypothetical protein